MEMENHVTCKNFTPNEIEEQLCEKLMNFVDSLAPSDSYVNAIIDKAANGTYQTIISIRSISGKFTSKSLGISPHKSLKKAQEVILQKLADWKKLRFT